MVSKLADTNEGEFLFILPVQLVWLNYVGHNTVREKTNTNFIIIDEFWVHYYEYKGWQLQKEKHISTYNKNWEMSQYYKK